VVRCVAAETQESGSEARISTEARELQCGDLPLRHIVSADKVNVPCEITGVRWLSGFRNEEMEKRGLGGAEYDGSRVDALTKIEVGGGFKRFTVGEELVLGYERGQIGNSAAQGRVVHVTPLLGVSGVGLERAHGQSE
jgi:hypothetical protein